MRFWDTSAIVPLVVEEARTALLSDLLAEDPDIIVWMLTSVELASALARRARELPNELEDAQALLDAMAALWKPIQDLRTIGVAHQVLRRHPLTAADALQLAAAIVAREETPSLEFVTLDRRLAAAALAEGFPVLP